MTKPILQRQVPPFNVKVEMTEGCNLRCAMCGIQGIREKAGGPYMFMSVETAEQIARGVAAAGWRSMIDFAQRGEPLMNPQAAQIIGAFRRALPNAYILLTSNATQLLRPPGVTANLQALFDNGLSCLSLDSYKPSHKAIKAVLSEKRPWPITGYGNMRDFPEVRPGLSPYKRTKASLKRIVIIEDVETAVLEGYYPGSGYLANQCGAAFPPPKEPLRETCARPFRNIVIRWDGRLALCCSEWRDMLRMGKFSDYANLEDAWNNPVMQAVRRKHYHKDRNFTPCAACSESTYRNGLLPDRHGAFRLPRPTPADEAALKAALVGGPQTRPVLRPWEKPSAETVETVEEENDTDLARAG